MADSKTSMEFFESNPDDETPEAVPATERKKNEDVIEEEFKPSLAFEKFAGKVYDTTASDFSDSSIRKISSRRGDYNTLRQNKQKMETPMERYNRLKSEMQEFQEELAAIATQADAKNDAVGDVSKAVSADLSKLEGELGTVLQDKRLAPFLEHSFPISQSDIVQKSVASQLLSELSKAATKTKPGPPGSSDGVTYELYYNPSANNKLDLAALDRRLATLESTVGGTEAAPGFPDIQTGLLHLQRKLELLDQQKLDAAYRRIKSLVAELELFEQQKAATSGKPTGQEQKIDELYKLMSRWDKSSEQLPLVVSRLQSLKDLHEESANAVARVQALEKQNAAIDSLLRNDQAALSQVSKSLATNVGVMAGNVKALETRFDELAKKMGKL